MPGGDVGKRREERGDASELRFEDGTAGVVREHEGRPEAIEGGGVGAVRGAALAPGHGAGPPAAVAARALGGREAGKAMRVQRTTEAAADEAALRQQELRGLGNEACEGARV